MCPQSPVLVKTPRGKTELAVAIFGKVLGLDPASGRQLWSSATDIGWYMVPSLVAHHGVVYCIGGRGDVTRTHRLWAVPKGSNECAKATPPHTDLLFHPSNPPLLHSPLDPPAGEPS